MILSYESIKLPEATRIQNELREKIDVRERELVIGSAPSERLPTSATQPLIINTIGGADISLNLYSSTIYAGIILLSFPQLQPIAYSLVQAETHFPYVPGYLAFREVPALIKAWDQLPLKPDVLVVDGHGIAHPRRMGIAAHFGAVTGQVSMGCAKNLLFGKFEEPSIEQGAFSPILSKEEQIGYVLRSKAKTAPVFVSPGHLLGRQNSLDIMKRCLGKYRIPEPTRLAHELVNRFRRNVMQEGIGEF